LTHTAAFTEAEVAEAEAWGFGPYRRYGIRYTTALLGLEYSVVRRLIAKGELGIIKVGKRSYVLGGHLAQYKMTHRTPTVSVQESPLRIGLTAVTRSHPQTHAHVGARRTSSS
jgi:hypothetical protein